MNMEIISTYIILNISLFITLIVTGYYISKYNNFDSKRYWIIASTSIIVYSIIEGLRYDRGTDYMQYKDLFEYSLNIQAIEGFGQVEPLFIIFNKFFRFFNFSYPYIFIFYSLILIIAAYYFIKDHKNVALFAVPFFLMSTISQSENLVRQFMAFSFILISLRFLLNNSWIKFGVLITMAVLTHASSILILPFLLLLKYVKNPFGNLYIILGLYFLSWLWKPQYWGNYVTFFQNIASSFNFYQGYLTNADIWLSGERLADVNSHFPLLSIIKTFLFNVGMIVLGYRILDKYRSNNYSFYFFLYVIGAISQRLTYLVEPLYRISLVFYMFWFIVLAYIVYDSFSCKTKSLFERIVVYYLIFSVIYAYAITLVRVDSSDALFIWS